MPTVLEVMRLSTAYLGRHGSSSPRLDTELLAAHALGLRRLDLYLQHDRPLDDGELASVRGLVRRRAGGEPVAHLVGVREFFGRAFAVSPAVLIPRPDTETLVEHVLDWARARAGATGEGLRLADLGTGSGCIACTLAAELPGATVVASDISPEALAVAEQNARRLGVAERVSFREGSWGDPLDGGERFQAVVSNPPYVLTQELAALARDVRDHEPALALDGGADGLAAYGPVLAAAARLAEPGGLVAVEVDPRRAEAVARLMAAALAPCAPVTIRDLAGLERVVSCCGDGCTIDPPSGQEVERGQGWQGPEARGDQLANPRE